MKRRKIYLPVVLFLIVITGFVCYSLGQLSSRTKRIPYSKWPQVRFKDVRILLASESKYAHQGFAGAEEKDFEKTLILFPGITGGTIFTNINQGYGPVIKDLKIVFFDARLNVLKEDILMKETGNSVAPAGTAFVIEGSLP
ncbi:MAG: hypothetical protein JW957_06045 [Candidatus Omnitrophica bacterium]|nr:hypothetical protein [Candidatus Omnitrophota bacterium]